MHTQFNNEDVRLGALVIRGVAIYIKFGLDDFFVFLCICFVQGRWQPTQSLLILIYSVDWTDAYDTHDIEHRTKPVSH